MTGFHFAGTTVSDLPESRFPFHRNRGIRGPEYSDRGCECYDTMAKLEKKGWNYLIRAREHKGIVSGLDLPASNEFDMQVDLHLVRKKNQFTIPLLQERNQYRSIPKTVRFDLLDPRSDDLYHLPF